MGGHAFNHRYKTAVGESESPGVTGPDNDHTIWSFSGPEISGPDNDHLGLGVFFHCADISVSDISPFQMTLINC